MKGVKRGIICIEISRTYIARKDKIVYSVFEKQKDGTLVSPFARVVLEIGTHVAVVINNNRICGCQVGFSRFGSIKSARKYERKFGRRSWGKLLNTVIVKSIIPKGAIVSAGVIPSHCCGQGMQVLLSDTIVQTDEVVGAGV